MRLTRAGEYAVRCMLYLSCLGVDTIGSRMEIAQQLAKAGSIEIVQGPKGGFRLVLPPEKVTLLGVIEAVKGKS